MSLEKNKIKILGAYGSKYNNMHTTCFLINQNICIDAGNILQPLGKNANNIEHILLTHSHLDHILDIPFLLDVTLSSRKKPLTIWALDETKKDIEEYIMNWHIWPDFSEINLLKDKEKKVVYFKTVEKYQTINLNNLKIKVIPANHTVPTIGYIINDKIYISGDTHKNDALVREINKNKNIEKLFIDVSFPKRLDNIALESKHHSTSSFYEEIKNIRDDLEIYIYHMKPQFIEEISKEIQKLPLKVNFLKEGQEIDF